MSKLHLHVVYIVVVFGLLGILVLQSQQFNDKLAEVKTELNKVLSYDNSQSVIKKIYPECKPIIGGIGRHSDEALPFLWTFVEIPQKSVLIITTAEPKAWLRNVIVMGINHGMNELEVEANHFADYGSVVEIGITPKEHWIKALDHLQEERFNLIVLQDDRITKIR